MLTRLREAGTTVPRFVLTADVQDSAKQQCLELGALRVLNKPPKEADLREAIDAALSAMETGR